ncbi:hypothetical protein [Mucilaginibacter sp.]|uniref:hypothetical protein n=1 Tax=Mucilaginibacter sp. TaxID=1882438 RepID=UPI00262B2EBD|nr:hypothetical protein [Mucilaginibacter sp.]
MIVKNFIQQPSSGLLFGAVPSVLSSSSGHFHVLAFDAGQRREHLFLLYLQS